MGAITLGWVCHQKVGDKAAKLVLMGIANCADDVTGECFPSIALLMEFAECSRPYLKEKLKFLEAEGWITKSERRAENSRQTSNLYKIIFDRGISTEKWRIEREAARKAREARGRGNYSTPSQGQPGQPGEGKPEQPLDRKPEQPPLSNKNEKEGADAPSASGAGNVSPVKVDWPHRLRLYRERGAWGPLDKWGPPLGSPGCIVPADLVELWHRTQGKAFSSEEPVKQPRRRGGWRKAG